MSSYMTYRNALAAGGNFKAARVDFSKIGKVQERETISKKNLFIKSGFFSPDFATDTDYNASWNKELARRKDIIERDEREQKERKMKLEQNKRKEWKKKERVPNNKEKVQKVKEQKTTNNRGDYRATKRVDNQADNQDDNLKNQRNNQVNNQGNNRGDNRVDSCKTTNQKLKTRFCIHILKGTACRYGSRCNFAHHPRELDVKSCNYDKKCLKLDCGYYHSHDDIIQYKQKIYRDQLKEIR